ncbi:uncharacterized protein LOC124264524 isoform X2 [Haliotis rubra]|nr:uncharacterized protein LOC124264524 isoform X2 [Haliotis rubra]
MWSIIPVLCLAVGLGGVHGQLPLCDEAPLVANIGYRYSTRECGHYLQCHKQPSSQGTGTIVVSRMCPHGYYWNQDLVGCRQSSQVTCPLEKCNNINARHFKMEGSSCRAYWQCSSFRSTPACCDPGFRYVPEQGCIGDLSCMDPCPGSCGSNDICRSTPDWNRPDYYFHYELERGTWNRYERKCPSLEVFDVIECGCIAPVRAGCTSVFSINFSFNSTDDISRSVTSGVTVNQGLGQFSDGSTLLINSALPTPTFDRPLLLKFRFNETVGRTGRRNLIQIQDNIQCNALTVDLNQEAIEISLTHMDKTEANLILSTRRFTGFIDVVVMYTGREISAVARAGNNMHLNRVSAPAYRVMNSLRVASSSVYPFSGFFDDVSLYNCHPKGRLVDLLDFV